MNNPQKIIIISLLITAGFSLVFTIYFARHDEPYDELQSSTYFIIHYRLDFMHGGYDVSSNSSNGSPL